MNQFIRFLTVVMLVAGTMGGCEQQPQRPQDVSQASAATPEARPARIGTSVGDMAPDWQLADPAGKKHSLSDYRGKVVILDFWATWCGPCKQAMPAMDALHKKLGNRGVAVIGMNCWERGDAPGYMKRMKYGYELLLQADSVASTYRVKSIPTFYVIGVDGRILGHRVGAGQERQLGALIETHLKEHGM